MRGCTRPATWWSPTRNGSARRCFCLDIMVPGKDGLELCRQIRQSVALASVPVIFLTAKSGEADRVLGLELGADDYIPKPFSPRELVARVKAVMRRFERPLPPLPTKVDEIQIDPGAMTLTVRVPTTTTRQSRSRRMGGSVSPGAAICGTAAIAPTTTTSTSWCWPPTARPSSRPRT